MSQPTARRAPRASAAHQPSMKRSVPVTDLAEIPLDQLDKAAPATECPLCRGYGDFPQIDGQGEADSQTCYPCLTCDGEGVLTLSEVEGIAAAMWPDQVRPSAIPRAA